MAIDSVLQKDGHMAKSVIDTFYIQKWPEQEILC